MIVEAKEKTSKPVIDFYWDIGSTNSYFAFKLIQPIVVRHNATINWHPFNLGFVFRSNNYVLMDEPGAKMRNRLADLNRWARRYDLKFRMPVNFPIKTSRALRAVIAMRQWNLEFEFMDAIFTAYWENNVGSIGEYQTLGKIAQGLGIDAHKLEAVSESTEVRQMLADSTNNALDLGVFGAPSIVIDKQLYWGKDRMEFVEDHLANIDSPGKAN